MLAIEFNSRFTAAIVIATIAVASSLASLPDRNFLLLRFILSGVSIILLVEARSRLGNWQRWLLCGAAVLYNPVLPIELGDPGLWTLTDLGTVFLFWRVEKRYGFPLRKARLRCKNCFHVWIVKQWIWKPRFCEKCGSYNVVPQNYSRDTLP